MVEINNQRKAFLDMLAWSEELITDVRKPEIMVMSVIVVGGETVCWLLDHPRKLVHAKPKTQINRRRTLSFFPVGGMPTASSLAWKATLRKVRTLWHCSRLRSVALYLWLIVVISVRQSTVAAISGETAAGALVMVGLSIRLTAWLQNSKSPRRNRSRKRLISQAESPRLSPLWLSASSSACHGLLITLPW